MKALTLTIAVGILFFLGANAQNSTSENLGMRYYIIPDSSKLLKSDFDRLNFDKGLNGYTFRKSDFFNKKNHRIPTINGRKRNQQDSLWLKEYRNQLPRQQREYKKRNFLPFDSMNTRNYSQLPEESYKKRPYIDRAELDNMPIYVPRDTYMPNNVSKSADKMPNPLLKQNENSTKSVKPEKQRE